MSEQNGNKSRFELDKKLSSVLVVIGLFISMLTVIGFFYKIDNTLQVTQAQNELRIQYLENAMKDLKTDVNAQKQTLQHVDIDLNNHLNGKIVHGMQ